MNKKALMKKIIVLLPEARVDSHFGIICEKTRFDFGRGLAFFDQIHVLPGGPHEKRICLRPTQGNQNDESIGRVQIASVGDNSVLNFVTESPNADFDEFVRLVINYFEDLNLLQLKKQADPKDAVKPEKKSAKPRKAKQYIKPAYRRVLVWELIAPQIEHDPSLKNNLHNLREWLLRNADEDLSKLKDDTLREIIKQGSAGNIKSREDFERENHM